MTSLSRRKHQITAPNRQPAIQIEERPTAERRGRFLRRLTLLALGGICLSGSALFGSTVVDAQQNQNSVHQPRLFNPPVNATPHDAQSQSSGNSLAMIRFSGRSLSSNQAASNSDNSHIEIPVNPLRTQPAAVSANQQQQAISDSPDDISQSVQDILGSAGDDSHVRQASAVEIIEIEPGDDWQKRRHVRDDVAPFPIKLNAATKAAPIEPKDDPFGDSQHSVLKHGESTRAIGFRSPGFQEGGQEEIEPGRAQRFEDDGSKQGDDSSAGDPLPEKRNQDRRFETNCDDVAAEVATRALGLIDLNLKPLLKTDSLLPSECPMARVGNPLRCWDCQTFTFTASALCHKPLYFENIQLERYGHSAGPFLQPIQSVAHFFARGALLPYQMGIHPPNECIYALGYYRPGDCAPWLRDPFPLSGRGLLYEAGFAVGAAYVIP